MTTDDRSFDSPREVVDALESTYLSVPYIEPEIDLRALFDLEDRALEYRRRRVAAFASELDSNGLCDLALSKFREGETGEPTALPDEAAVAYYETALAYAGVLVDVASQYPDITRQAVTRRLNTALREGPETDSEYETLLAAGQAVFELSCVVRDGHQLLEWLRAIESDRTVRFAHPADSAERLQTAVERRIESADAAGIAELRERVNAVIEGEWTAEDLLRFDPIQFEHLLADLWECFHDASRTTKARQDRGVDVVIKLAQGGTLLIQAKRYAPGNTVGIGEVQRTAGLLAEFTATRAALVTSATFTESAKESARGMDDVFLVNGDLLCHWLSQSVLCPPTGVHGSG